MKEHIKWLRESDFGAMQQRAEEVARAIESELQAQASGPVAAYFCEKCGYSGSTSEHPSCDYFAVNVQEATKIARKALADKLAGSPVDAWRLTGIEAMTILSALLTTQQPAVSAPVATLHCDGYWTHPAGKDPLDRFSQKSKLEVFSTPQPAPPCPRCAEALEDSRVFNDGLRRLGAKNTELQARCAELSNDLAGLQCKYDLMKTAAEANALSLAKLKNRGGV